MRPRFSRPLEILKIRNRLERDGYPRLQMLLLVTLTGAAGFLASYALLQLGLTEMWLRYLAAVGMAYLVFLFLLWLWLRTRADDYNDVPDFSGLMPASNGGSSSLHCGQGGEYGGGGASGSFDHPIEPISLESASGSTDNSLVGDALSTAADAEEFAIPLVVLILVGVLLLSSTLIIYSAPVLFAELLVDGVLAASLYRRLRGLETRHWLETAIRRTFWPFMLAALLAAAAGWGMARYAPGASSIGDVMFYASMSHG